MKLSLWLALLVCFTTFARVEIHQFDDPAKEAIYKQLIQELRCLVCQNQNLADSNAELATDLRNKTYEMVKTGKNRSEIVEYMVTRYGDFVLYKPPLKTSTLLLWIGPFSGLLLAIIFLIVYLRKRNRVAEKAPYTSAQLEQARKLLTEQEQQ